MIYRFLKQLITLALFFFFKKIIISGKKNILTEGPFIIVANHPNTFMDPLIIASLMQQQIGFIGNAGLFMNPFFAKVFRFFHVIPIFRKKDIKPGEKPDNKKSFIKCHEYFDENGSILIFPEGSSIYELKLRKIKTGTARIALSYDSKIKSNNELKILPISLDYSDAIQFRSLVSVTIDAPISIEKYKSLYNKDERQSVLNLTQSIQEVFENNIPNTTNKDQEQFLLKTHYFYTTFNDPSASFKVNPKESLASRTQISKSLSLLKENNESLYIATEKKVHLFFDYLNNEDLSPGFFTTIFDSKNKSLVLIIYFLKFLFLSPIYLFGIFTNYIPYILPSSIFKLLKLDIEYKTPVQMVIGIFSFPLFYWLELKLIGSYVHLNLWSSMLLILTFLISGYIAMYYWTEIKRFKRVLHFYFFLKTDTKKSIIKLKDEILMNIEIAKNSLS